MPRTSAIPLDYRPHLDGLRAFAVYLVVFFHAGVQELENGFIGVDIFFVLSGYLVTAILLRDLESSSGKIDFGNFYSRRIKRLLPAALVNLTATALIFGAIATTLQFEEARNGIRAAALYFANWQFIWQSADYFAADVLENPVQHYWSLSVEEQYYFVWPLLLATAWSLARHTAINQRRALQAMTVVGAILSYLLARHFASMDMSRAYYGSDTRAYQLMVGGLLALSPGLFDRIQTYIPQKPRAMSAIGAFMALCLLSTPFLDVDPIWRGLAVALCAGMLIVFLESSSSGMVRSVLSQPSLVYLGKISYGTYLWHWLVIIVLSHLYTLTPLVLALVAMVVSTVVASASFHVIENPIRVKPLTENFRYASVIIGLALSLLVGLVIAPGILGYLKDQSDIESRAGIGGGGKLPSANEIRTAWANDYEGHIEHGCTIGADTACVINVQGNKKAIVVGDSHAQMYTPMLAEVTARHDISLYAGYLEYCPWPAGLRYGQVGIDCFRDQEVLYSKIIPELDPDIVFLAHMPVDDLNRRVELFDASFGFLRRKDERRGDVITGRTVALIEALRKDGRLVVVMEPIPIVARKNNTLGCLQKAQSLKECRFTTRDGPGIQESAIRTLVEDDPGVLSLDLDKLICPDLPVCDAVVDGMIVKRDDNHLTLAFSKSLSDDIDTMLLDSGILDELKD